ncbi:hypothetical protein [Vulcanisaeta distributa]|uniref:Uncharacterized protein n=1 Tax=Vulcanisaeta distributa (strain DSM 14429 / JCM 11212 / NBRC 100878 / IC-017) TaxID=572478 RepID=E1QU92_VULDI|nr:hypothetical protein [Vulcanisaeta distributa]ADN51086.1 conserved hypothetical protein [Vulcanisaeta distributa DSM 14429]
MAITCSRWEKLIEKAEREGNKEKALEFREKLVECVVYTAQELIARGRSRDLDEAEELLKYGEEVGNKLGINELLFHVNLLRKRIEEKRERRRPKEAEAKQ